MEAIAIFLTGVAAGITWYKFFIVYVLERFTHTMCDYCEFQIKKEELFPAKKKSDCFSNKPKHL